jgi:hypothetical protein
MRSYVKPSNPNSLAQQANRLQMAAIVALYQANVKGTAINEAAWNTEALPSLVSGYNLFTKYGRRGAQTKTGGLKDPGITIGSLAHGALSITLNASAIPADRVSLMTVSAAGVPIVISTKRGLGEYQETDFAIAPAATDLIYVVDTKVLAGADVEATAKMYKAVNHWVPNETTGAITPMVCT